MIRILFLVIFVAALYVPFFNKVQPALFGFPFFYWYQLAVVIGGSVLTFIVFRAESGKEAGK